MHSLGHATAMKPSIVSDPHNWDINRFGASRALTDTDKTNDNAKWHAKNHQAAHFIYDLGKTVLISRRVLRNSGNGKFKDRYLFP